MRQFAYIGEGDTVAYGLPFPHGVPVAVDDVAWPVVARKLAGNRFFSEIIEGVEIVEAPVEAKRGPGRPRKVRP